MHLAREADARERFEFAVRMAADRRDRRLDPLEPVLRVLLAPERVGALDAQGGRGFRHDQLIGVDQQRLD